MLKILMLTSYDSTHEPVAKVSLPGMREYAERHNCEFRALTSTVSDRYPTWIKIPSIRDALTEDFDFVWWLDVDTCIVRNDIDIRTAIQPDADLHLAWIGPETTDWQAPGALAVHAPLYNDGVMVIRTSSWSKDFFAQVWETGDLDGTLWHEQSTIMHLLGCGDPLRPKRLTLTKGSRVAHLDAAWNCIAGIATTRNPIIRHYAGMANSIRLPFMKIDCETLAPRNAEPDELRSILSNQLDAYLWEVRKIGKKIKLLSDRLDQTNAELAEIEKLASFRAAEIANLSSKVAILHEEATRSQRDLDAMRRSRSWRLTAPLRSARQALSSWRAKGRA